LKPTVVSQAGAGWIGEVRFVSDAGEPKIRGDHREM
jgi:hypothetical protein